MLQRVIHMVSKAIHEECFRACLLVPDMEVWGQQACPRVLNGKTRREAVNRICVCMYMLCTTPMMFYLYKSVKTP
jgi:hypothetical protein